MKKIFYLLITLTVALSSAEAQKKKKQQKPKGKPKSGIKAVKQVSKDESIYFYYKPETAPESGNVSALFWTAARPGNEKDLAKLKIGADLTGMVLVVCGSSSNAGKNNSTHVDNNLNHALAHLSIDSKRLFFAGTSGGGLRSLRNSDKYPCAGGMPVVAHNTPKYKPRGDFYVIGGAFDFNRYASAFTAELIGNDAIHRLVPGGHTNNDIEALNDGVIWLYTKNIYLRKKGTTEEREAFEKRFYKYLTEDLADEPWRAYYWTQHLIKTAKMSGRQKQIFINLNKKLEADPKNKLYLSGRKELEKISEKHMSDVSRGTGSLMKHTTPNIQKAATKFLEKYKEFPRLAVIARDLKKKTDAL